MTNSPDHPSLQFIQAKGYTAGRPDGKPLWIVVHDMEASERSDRAESTAQYFANPGDGRQVSSHYTADNNSVVQCVRLRDSAWTVGNRPGNNRGINWEFAGRANQTRAQWLDPFGLDMFARAAPIMRHDSGKYDIPLERRTVAELEAWTPGVTSHNDLRLAFGGTTHTDPGTRFPWDEFMEIINGGDMYSEAAMRAFPWQYDGRGMRGVPEAHSTLWVFGEIFSNVRNIQSEVAAQRVVIEQLAAAIAAGGGSVDTAAILTGVDERLAAHRAAIEADTRDVVSDLAEGGAAQVRADQ